MVAGCQSGLMRQVVAKKIFKGVLVEDKKVEVGLLQYVDDTIFFGDAS